MTLTKKLAFFLISASYAATLALQYLFIQTDDYRYAGIILSAILLVFANFILIKIYGYNDYLKSKMVFVSIALFFGFFFLHFFPTLGYYSRIAYITATSIGMYMLLLAINVYIVSEKREDSIPLLQPAKVIVYLAYVATVFVASTVIYKLEWFINFPMTNLLMKIILFTIFYSILFISSSWVFVSEGGVGGETFNAEDMSLLKRLQIFAVICMTQISFVLMFFPFEAFGKGVILGGTAYYLSNFIQNYLAHKVNMRFTLEAVGALSFIYLLVYFT